MPNFTRKISIFVFFLVYCTFDFHGKNTISYKKCRFLYRKTVPVFLTELTIIGRFQNWQLFRLNMIFKGFIFNIREYLKILKSYGMIKSQFLSEKSSKQFFLGPISPFFIKKGSFFGRFHL